MNPASYLRREAVQASASISVSCHWSRVGGMQHMPPCSSFNHPLCINRAARSPYNVAHTPPSWDRRVGVDDIDCNHNAALHFPVIGRSVPRGFGGLPSPTTTELWCLHGSNTLRISKTQPCPQSAITMHSPLLSTRPASLLARLDVEDRPLRDQRWPLHPS